jgi:hypothetical protein
VNGHFEITGSDPLLHDLFEIGRRFALSIHAMFLGLRTGVWLLRLDALLQFVLRCLKYVIGCFLDADEVVPRVLGSNDQFVELQLERQRISVFDREPLRKPSTPLWIQIDQIGQKDLIRWLCRARNAREHHRLFGRRQSHGELRLRGSKGSAA